MAGYNSGEPIDPRNPLSKLDERVGMHLSYWAYPQPDIENAKDIAKHPEPIVPYPVNWEHAKPGIHLPSDWPVAQQDGNGQLLKGSPEGWNTQHNAEGKLENQFMVSINRETHEITFDFKGSDAKSNWVSDFKNAGASEFAKIQAQAQKAYDEIINNPDYKDYQFSATGHSLGGGMAQSFALKNNLDVYVYNSLPIARDTISGDYFADVGGFNTAIERYKNAHHQVHDVRTPNDIATYNYDKVMDGQYLSSHVEPGPTLLPGSSLPPAIKTVLMLSGYGTPVATAIMGKDHTMGSLFNGQQGLAVGDEGRYRIPEGHQNFAAISPEARKRFAQLSESPVIEVSRTDHPTMTSREDKFLVTHEDGSKEYISVNANSGYIDVNRYGSDGKRMRMEMNELRKLPATVTEFDADGRPTKTEIIAMYTDDSAQSQTTLVAQNQTLKPENLNSADVDKLASAIINARIAENLANNPEFLSRLASSQQFNVQEELSRG